eukprot:scaffold51832_cov57-Attheya_sp.AAC.4
MDPESLLSSPLLEREKYSPEPVGLDEEVDSLQQESGSLYHSSALRHRSTGVSVPQHDLADESSGGERILDREGRFGQSRGKWNVWRRLSPMVATGRASRSHALNILSDWFHHLVYQPTVVLMLVLLIIYTAIIFGFAAVYFIVSQFGSTTTTNEDGTIEVKSFCGMDLTNHMEALYFSLSTMSGIGYGVSDYYFGDCWTPLLLVLLQIFVGIVFGAVAVGVLFLRMSRGQKRVKSIIFSDQAIVRRVRGVSYIMFRVAELRRHHIVQAHVRVYCIRHERTPLLAFDDHPGGTLEDDSPMPLETTHFLTRQLRLVTPNSDIGSYILMSLPQVVVHRMDGTSPIRSPEPVWYDKHGLPHCNHIALNNTAHGSSGDSSSGHKLDEEMHPCYDREREGMKLFLQDRDTEIVVLVEGTDELTGCAVQARHSYRWDDIVWDYTFGPCIFPTTSDDSTMSNHIPDEERPWCIALRGSVEDAEGASRVGRPAKDVCYVDYAKFHNLLPAPLDCTSCPFVPQDMDLA